MSQHFKIIAFIWILILFSCSNPKPRKPISKTNSNFIEASIKRNIIINQQEEAFFKKLRQKDTLHQYINSKLGFWYYVKNRQDSVGIKPKKGDEVVINYEIKSINNEVILSADQLGSRGQENKKDRLYKIDGESFILGIQDAVKLLQKGDSAVLLLPSNKAFGPTGFQDIIHPNEPLIIDLYLKDIKTKNP